MKLYNTLTRQIEEIMPLKPPEVKVYTCGPTVYDYAHIGHWFNYVRMDTLIRTLKANGFATTWVMNITDVGHLTSDADEGEDKLEKGARREGKTAWEVAEFYTQDFLNGMQALNLLSPDHLVKATEHIPEQVALIQKLEEKGYTYTIDDGVYPA
jgi:cysteinyl-tRNA synthetase